MELKELLAAIQTTHEYLQNHAVQQVNSSLTIRNWIVGLYLIEYEQNGEDRAAYGKGLLKQLAMKLKKVGLKSFDERSLRHYRTFYLSYPQMWAMVSPVLQVLENQSIIKRGMPSPIFKKVSEKFRTASIQMADNQSFPPEMLLSRLSFSHFIELSNTETALKRAFYEVQAIKNNWTVKELERASLETLKQLLEKDRDLLNNA